MPYLGMSEFDKIILIFFLEKLIYGTDTIMNMSSRLSEMTLQTHQKQHIHSSYMSMNRNGHNNTYTPAGAASGSPIISGVTGSPFAKQEALLGGGATSNGTEGTTGSSILLRNLNVYSNAVVHPNDVISDIKSKATGTVNNIVSNAQEKVTNTLSQKVGGIANQAMGLAGNSINKVLGQATDAINGAVNDALNKFNEVLGGAMGDINPEAAAVMQKLMDPRSLTDMAVNYGLMTLSTTPEFLTAIGKSFPGCFGTNKVHGNDASASASDEAEGGGDNQLQDTNNTTADTQIMSPFIWTGGNNWCGINYGMVGGARVLSQKLPTGQSIAMGCVVQDPSIIKPTLDPGAICIKGFGNNQILWESADRLTVSVGSSQGSNDFAYDKGGQKTSVEPKTTPNGSNMFITLDGHEETLTISVTGTEEQKTSTIVITGTTITCTTTDFIVNAEKNITMTAGENISMTAGQTASTEAGESITNDAGENVQIKAGSTSSAGGGGVVNIATNEGAIGLMGGIMSQDMSFIKHNEPVSLLKKAKQMAEKVKDLGSNLKNMATKMIGNLVNEGLGKAMNMAKGAMNAVQQGMSTVQNTVNNVKGAVNNVVSGVTDGLKGATNNIVGSVRDAAGGAIQSGQQALGQVTQQVQQVAGPVIQQATQTVNNLVQNNSVQKLASQATEAAAQLGNMAASATKINNITSGTVASMIHSLENRGYLIHANDEDYMNLELSNGAYEILVDSADLVNESVNLAYEAFDQFNESLNISKDAIASAVSSYDMITALTYTANSIIERIENNTISADELDVAIENMESIAAVIDSAINNTEALLKNANKSLDKTTVKVNEIEDTINESAEIIYDITDELDAAEEELEEEKRKEEEETNTITLSESQKTNYRKIDKASQYVIDYHDKN